MEKAELKQLLRESWSRSTSSPEWRSKWRKDICSLGQSDITSLIVNEYFGGLIMCCNTSLGDHYYNIIDGTIIDLTADQFLGERVVYFNGIRKTRDVILNDEETKQRYLLLKASLFQAFEEKRQRIQNKLQMVDESKSESVFINTNSKLDTLYYLKYDNLNMDEELAKMEYCSKTELVLEPTNKNCLFILGMLFANGIKIKIINEQDLSFDETSKSFPTMAHVWSLLGNNNFPSPDYSNVKTGLDNRIENIKRLGVTPSKIIDNPLDNKIFLICPVRNASEEQKQWIENLVKQKTEEGYIIHAPHLHTRQTDMFGGYAICKQNADAMASSSEVDMLYDSSSTGSAFDLGVAYALHKPLKVLNEEVLSSKNDDLITIVCSWPFNEPVKSRQMTI